MFPALTCSFQLQEVSNSSLMYLISYVGFFFCEEPKNGNYQVLGANEMPLCSYEAKHMLLFFFVCS